MWELNVLTAVPVGIISAIIWLALFLRRVYANVKYAELNTRERLGALLLIVAVFPPSALFGFGAGVFISNCVVQPGPWSHISLAITFALAVGIFGAVIPIIVARSVLVMILRRNSAPHSGSSV